MAFCKNCGTDIGDANVCSACGAVQVEETAATPVQETPATPVFSADPSSYSSGSSEIPAAPVAQDSSAIPTYSAPVYNASTEEMPSTTGQVVFAIINIVIGVLFCCCLYGLSLVGLVLGIIALVMALQAGKATSAAEANQKLKTAKTMNIIAVIVSGAALILGLIIGAISGASSYSEIMKNLPNSGDYY